MDESPDGLKLISEVIREKLGIKMSVLMGANIANEVADEKFCETTIGEADEKLSEYVRLDRFYVSVIICMCVFYVCKAAGIKLKGHCLRSSCRRITSGSRSYRKQMWLRSVAL